MVEWKRRYADDGCNNIRTYLKNKKGVVERAYLDQGYKC